VAQQEQRAKRQRAADIKFDSILEAAVAKVKANRDLQPDSAELVNWREVSPLDGDAFLLAASVRHLRDHLGVSWWQIGQQLGLPGAGANAATGKGGAGFARKLYAKGFGAAPRTQKERQPASYSARLRQSDPQLDDRKALKATSKEERREMVQRGEPVLRPTMTNEEVEQFVAGRHIAWSINLDTLDGKGDQFFEQEADVHRKNVWCVERKGHRVVIFHEVDRNAPLNSGVRELAGAVRTVRISAIHSVR
jgi:hypothetical protein